MGEGGQGVVFWPRMRNLNSHIVLHQRPQHRACLRCRPMHHVPFRVIITLVFTFARLLAFACLARTCDACRFKRSRERAMRFDGGVLSHMRSKSVRQRVTHGRELDRHDNDG